MSTTTSPVLTNPARASASLRNAHARAHTHPCPHANALPADAHAHTHPGGGPIPRRPSSRGPFSADSASMKSPADPRSTRPAAATDEAAIEAQSSAWDCHSAQSANTQPAVSPRPQPNNPKEPTAPRPSRGQSQRPLAAPSTDPQTALSPQKRRGSLTQQAVGQGASSASPDASYERSPKTSKRARAGDSPPKVLPRRYELCAPEDMVELISHMLAELITTNDAIGASNGGLTRFHSRTPPGISVRDYLHRLAKHATLTPPLLLAMVYYIDRLCLMYHEFTINTLTVHRFLITAATVAAKGLSDSFWNNTTYARVGGVRVAELKMLELEFLHRVDWKIVPKPEDLVAYYSGLVKRTPGYTVESDGSPDSMEDSSDGLEEGSD